MTDKEIIKALECCSSPKANCEDCPCFNKDCISTTPYVLDLINRQQETIETLRKCVEQHHIIRKDGKSPLSLLTAEIRAEAIKEFAKRLKERLKGNGGLFCVTTMNAQIDNLVKEMVGEDK